jgi:hypothetical protein
MTAVGFAAASACGAEPEAEKPGAAAGVVEEYAAALAGGNGRACAGGVSQFGAG